VVVKRFRPEYKHHLSVEMNILQQVRNAISTNQPPFLNRLPECKGKSNDNTALILTPIGKHFFGTDPGQSLPLATWNHFADLVNLLEFVHVYANLVHRDIKLSNFFQRSDNPNEILLNDWTCAVQIGVSTTFEGALPLAPDGVLQLLKNNSKATYTPKAEDDLEMVVKCFFQRVCNSTFGLVAGNNKVSDLIDFWNLHLQPVAWQRALTAARNLDYQGLIDVMKDLIP